ncbi:MAG TPA: aspartate carbamoyltransferase catalytic subunit [Myxococcota bacterium]|nr:aspartate carbamoyltransferase catalytic subunit [Myxococcota bacterium]HOC99874.1 aspartate carbamoyltransferase catalytic subunit [Myxococcota bacterium]HOH76702.1 aspartate carbamoyltransferase catalytic subunit [Myxococcota bacterium]HPV04672.1 aspartate carbamoyltransferase catalytic subunit [Myxococcota bacterium]
MENPNTLNHLLALEGLSKETVTSILDHAVGFKEVSKRRIKKVPPLRGVTVVLFFIENSTRTRISFEVAAKRLSADTLNFSASTSSLSKGETLLDTAKNLMAMQPDIIVMRHFAPGAAKFLSERIPAGIVNAGDGPHAHPTQALLDMYTMRERKGRLEGLEVAIVGDIAHSRVARSNIHGLLTMGAKVRLAGPRTMLPTMIDRFPVSVHDRIEPAIEGADVVMMLRIQKERMGKDLFPSDREYARVFGLDSQKLKLAKPDCLVMHPGPMNRGVEITPEVADSTQSVILEQVENGVAVRMAVLFMVARHLGVSEE